MDHCLKDPCFLNSFLVICFFTNKKRTDQNNWDTLTDFVGDRWSVDLFSNSYSQSH